MTDEPKKEEQKEEEKPAVKTVKAELPVLKAGQKIKVHQKIKDGKKERIQVFEGIILGVKGQTPATKTITVRKHSEGVDVEKIFPLAMPAIEKIEVISKLNTRQSKVYYIRDYKKKLKEVKA